LFILAVLKPPRDKGWNPKRIPLYVQNVNILGVRLAKKVNIWSKTLKRLTFYIKCANIQIVSTLLGVHHMQKLLFLGLLALLAGCDNSKCVDGPAPHLDGRALYVKDLENGYFKSRGGKCYALERLKKIEANRDVIICPQNGGECKYGTSS